MKKQLLLSTLILWMCAGGAYAQLIFTSDFSSAQGYKDGPVVNQPTGATSMWLNGMAAVPADNIVVKNESLVTTATGVDAKWVIMMIPVQKTSLTVTWDWWYTGPSDRFVDTGFCLSDTRNFTIDDNADPAWNEQSAMVRMTNDTTNGTGVIDVRDGDWMGGGGLLNRWRSVIPGRKRKFPCAVKSISKMGYSAFLHGAKEKKKLKLRMVLVSAGCNPRKPTVSTVFRYGRIYRLPRMLEANARLTILS